MIIPAGRKRDQVNQGPLKHGSLLDDSMLKVAIGLNPEDAMRPKVDVPDDLQKTVNDSPSRLNENPDAIPGVDAGQPTPAEGNPAAVGNGDAGAPSQLGQGHQDFATIANELSSFLQNSEVLTNDYVLIDQKRDQSSSRWTFIIEPVRQAAPAQMQQKVSPQGPPIGEPMGGGGGGGMAQAPQQPQQQL